MQFRLGSSWCHLCRSTLSRSFYALLSCLSSTGTTMVAMGGVPWCDLPHVRLVVVCGVPSS